jgi:hypothetical protein
MAIGLRVLFCADPLRPTRPDQHFASEAELVRSLGGDVALIDHDELLASTDGDADRAVKDADRAVKDADRAVKDADRAVRRVPGDSGPWWYRGWMIPSAVYGRLAEALRRKRIQLRVDPGRYRVAHELPGWFSSLVPVTPHSVWIPWSRGQVPTEDDVASLARGLGGRGPAIVKDYVKSRKHEWEEACFIPDLADLAHATAVVARMVELQGDLLNGGIVLRRFEPYRREGGRTVEARVWWVDGKPVMVSAHPDTPGLSTEPDLRVVAPLVESLGCPFVTTDLAQRTDDGRWRVVELGDGQVSDLPAGADPTPVFAGLQQGKPLPYIHES